MRLAFVAALQHLSPRQRAVLVLRDVLQWKAAEVADAIGASTAAVNSLLQRARSQLKAAGPSSDDRLAAPDSADAQDRLTRYIAAFEAYDIDRLAELFTSEAIWEMPPFVGWYQGPRAIIALIHQQCPAQTPGDMRLIPLTANGQPAAAMYMRDGEHHVPFQLHVLDVRRRRGVACGGVPGHRAVREIWSAATALSRRVASYATRSRKIRAITGHSAPA